mmetsp:Transcript_29083/g.46649  ORF Transcript_29083/g.46649 Transcript_29083/m.46649 type:complete len:89 (+) Transcript_29083:212-478(+)
MILMYSFVCRHILLEPALSQVLFSVNRFAHLAVGAALLWQAVLPATGYLRDCPSAGHVGRVAQLQLCPHLRLIFNDRCLSSSVTLVMQ